MLVGGRAKGWVGQLHLLQVVRWVRRKVGEVGGVVGVVLGVLD